MEEIKFGSFKPIIKYSDQNKRDLAEYYQKNNITPNNEYLTKYLAGVPMQSNNEIENVSPQVQSVKSIKDVLSEGFSTLPVLDSSTSNISKPESKSAKDIINFFVNKGLSKEQAAGIAGNLHAESAFNTNAIGDENTSYGLAQWRLGRRTNLENFTKQKGLAKNSFNGQLEFLWNELQTTHNDALKALIQTKTPENAAEVFANKFEKMKKYETKRAIMARKFYES